MQVSAVVEVVEESQSLETYGFLRVFIDVLIFTPK